jgi:FkbH-like protein
MKSELTLQFTAGWAAPAAPAPQAAARSDTALPELTVIDVPADPSDYVRALDAENLFDTLSVTDEDRLRGQFFQQSQAREQLITASGGYDEFLRNLAMRAYIEPIQSANVSRVTQLINKTNQFNLTTRRMTDTEVESLIGSRGHYTSTTRLDDRFGSNGLISVVIGHIDSGVLDIDIWLMSCRVLKRGVEILEMERLLMFCRERGVNRIIGHYRPTEKNKLVADHYRQLGFIELAGEPGGTSWLFVPGEQRLELQHFIGVE